MRIQFLDEVGRFEAEDLSAFVQALVMFGEFEHLKRVAIFQIRSSRFRSLFLGMSLSQNRCSLLRDML
ncbi:hypothetical protein RLTA1_15960 [Rhizobium leguminosarum bv. trifolii TA1]|nr:hypothetical protein [Rhizobium leguminosarum]MBY5859454.1 hypothetical protein [Rhizobium leguminosarum]MBY5870901.1 hypothetical protein [Rhizobium leguminosarum]QJS25777.1 hypothetical protein RLTA1_15960 [Rhizobium leguminosarum bv. trifolii TA1]